MAVPDGKRWFKITVEGGVPFGLAGGAINNRLTEQLPQIVAMGQEKVTVLRTRSPRDTGDFYFSPGASLLLADIVTASAGVPCEEPTSSDDLVQQVGMSTAPDVD